MHVVSQPELPHAVLVELQRLIDAALSSSVSSTHGRYGDAQTGDQQKDLFEEASNERLLPTETLSEVVAQLALLMQSVIDAIETEVRDEQDPR